MTNRQDGNDDDNENPSSGNVPAGELAQLLQDTNFTDGEIAGFYKYGIELTKQEFATLCLEQGIKCSSLVERMWSVFDQNHDGNLTSFELVLSLNSLLRGTQEQVAGFFFDLYDFNGDGNLSAAELIAVYSDAVSYNEKEERKGLSAEEKTRLRTWVKDVQAEKGTLDKKAFVEEIRRMDIESGKGASSSSLLTWRTFYLVFLVSWFEMGTSFSLPAMGALSNRVKERFEIGDTEIGTLTSAYFLAAMVGPLIGGLFMDKYGPGPVIIGANIVVVMGASLQAIANGKDQFAVLLLGRLLLGLGGEITPFTTVEILGRLFPDHLGLMAGIRNLVQSVSTFLAFVLLPIWAEAMSSASSRNNDDIIDNNGTSFALWMCAVLGGMSLLTCMLVQCLITKERNAASAEEQSDQATVSKMVRSFALATTPRLVGIQKWKLPLSFFFAVFGIKAQYFAPFAFTAFSNTIYSQKFSQTRSQSSLLSGFISFLAGLLGPFMGPLSDKFGGRSLSLAGGCLLSLIGFALLAVVNGGSAPVWLASTFFAIQYGFGDTVAYISIRFIVGISRAGIGYGVYGIFGNLVATVVPIIGGALLDQDNGQNKVLWYFAGLMGLGALCWVVVFFLEGSRSLLELPATKVVETSDHDIQMAALTHVVACHESKKQQKKNARNKKDDGSGQMSATSSVRDGDEE